jgi:hypothetical protein
VSKKSQPLETHQSEHQGISRREMVHRLVAGASGGLMAATDATARPAHSPDLAAPAERTAKTADSQPAPLFLDPHQKETLIVLAERIVPGSTQADVAGFLDLLLSVDTQENQKSFIASLSAMDGESLRQYGHPFKNLTEARQNELLMIASTPMHGGPGANESGLAAAFAAPPEPPPGILNEHFENLKGWITKAYYSSEIGMRELGWTGNYFFPTFPGCEESKA